MPLATFLRSKLPLSIRLLSLSFWPNSKPPGLHGLLDYAVCTQFCYGGGRVTSVCPPLPTQLDPGHCLKTQERPIWPWGGGRLWFSPQSSLPPTLHLTSLLVTICLATRWPLPSPPKAWCQVSVPGILTCLSERVESVEDPQKRLLWTWAGTVSLKANCSTEVSSPQGPSSSPLPHPPPPRPWGGIVRHQFLPCAILNLELLP